MKNYRVILMFIFFVLLFGCKTREVASKITSNKSDTLIVKSETVTRPPILTSLIINEICDSVTNKPKEFKQVFVVGQDTMELSVKNNELQFNINELEKTISEKDSIISSKSSDYVKETVNEKKVIPKWVWYALLLIPLFILFPVIPKVINKFFRGLIKI